VVWMETETTQENHVSHDENATGRHHGQMGG
jgi:hypothetical protein